MAYEVTLLNNSDRKFSYPDATEIKVHDSDLYIHDAEGDTLAIFRAGTWGMAEKQSEQS